MALSSITVTVGQALTNLGRTGGHSISGSSHGVNTPTVALPSGGVAVLWDPVGITKRSQLTAALREILTSLNGSSILS